MKQNRHLAKNAPMESIVNKLLTVVSTISMIRDLAVDALPPKTAQQATTVLRELVTTNSLLAHQVHMQQLLTILVRTTVTAQLVTVAMSAQSTE
jgi:hypothetical protein